MTPPPSKRRSRSYVLEIDRSCWGYLTYDLPQPWRLKVNVGSIGRHDPRLIPQLIVRIRPLYSRKDGRGTDKGWYPGVLNVEILCHLQ